MMKVKTSPADIFQDGNWVGEFQGTRSEVWVCLKDSRSGKLEAVGRYKYLKPKTKANRFLKAVLATKTPEEVIDYMKAGGTPVALMREMGVYDDQLH